MKIQGLTRYLSLLGMAILLATASCKDKEVGTAATISGKESKTWKASKETTASGEKDKLSQNEKMQEIQFFANGSFRMRSPSQSASGKWNYDPMARTMTLQFVGSDMTETFQVLNLSDDEMTLQAADGSQMELQEE